MNKNKLRIFSSLINNQSLIYRSLIVSLGAILLVTTKTNAAPVSPTPPTNCPPLEPGTTLQPGSSVLTANTISLRGLTTPSLWWANEQFGNKLLNNWCAYPTEQRVDLIVNRQIWSLLTYLERYEFVNHFGTTARDFRYNLRVFNQQKTLLASYTCDFSTTPASCNLWIDTPGGRSFQ